MRQWMRMTGALAVVGLLAVACAPVEDEEDAGAGGEQTDDQGDDGEEAEADPSATVRYADSLGPSTFDPHRSTTGQDIRHFTPVYDRLVHLDAEGEPVPGLAESFEFVDDEGTEFRMELREGVTFHDGEPFDAEAVKANIERGQTLEGSSIAEDLADIEEVEVVDEHEVLLHLSEPNAMLPGMLSHRAGAMVSPAAFENDDLDQMPVGAGMYEVVEHREGDEIVFERYEDYWDDDVVGAARLEAQILPDETARLNALRTGEVHLAALGARQVSDAEAAGLAVESDTALHYLWLALDRSHPALETQEVRQALNHAIDREAIVDSVLDGHGEPTVQPFPEGYWGHNPDYPGDHYEFDPERAEELLAEAGYEDGFSFEIIIPSLSVYERTAEVVQRMFADVGITAELRVVEPAQIGEIYYVQRDGDAMLAQWGGRPDPSMTIELQFTADSFNNPGRHSTEEMEQLNDEALATVDFDERREVIHENVAHIVEQAFEVPIAHEEGIYAMTDEVVGFETLITGQPNVRTLGLAAEGDQG